MEGIGSSEVEGLPFAKPRLLRESEMVERGRWDRGG